MADVYHKVDTNFRTSLHYLSGGAAVTGLTQASFTIQIQKNGTGNQATTGVTLTEVDATNNAGEYYIEVSGSTGFVTATGYYSLVIFRTSVVTDRWTINVRVNETGLPDGTTGPAEFTATASDGRVTDGSSALAGATVYLRTASGVIVTEATTDASGLWGPVFLSETVTAYAQKSGYAQDSGTITISGSTATGPATDLELTAVAASSGLTASSLWAYIKRQARNATGSLTDQHAKDILNDALAMLAKARQWKHYEQLGQLTLNGAYSTGTIAITNGSTTVTLTTGTWPSWAANGELLIDGQWYSIASRTNDTVLVLDESWVPASISGESYVLYQDAYALPNDCFRMGELFYGDAWRWGEEWVSYVDFLRAKNDCSTGDAYADVWSIANQRLHLWPYPSSNLLLNFSYYRKPASVDNSGDEADWDPAHLDLLHRACEYQIALRYGKTSADMDMGACERAWDKCLAYSIGNDRSPRRHLSPLAGRARGKTDMRNLPAS